MENGLLSFYDLLSLVDQGVITNCPKELVNGTSIDVTLAPTLLVESSMKSGPIDIAAKEPLRMRQVIMGESGYVLSPGEFILAGTEQLFYLPNWLSMEYKLKSSQGRSAMEHMNAGWCDAGWNGSCLTLEFKNMSQYHPLRIRPGMRVGQVIFTAHNAVPEEASYAKRGRYNGDLLVSGVKQ